VTFFYFKKNGKVNREREKEGERERERERRGGAD
jgi:hypothetical protein